MATVLEQFTAVQEKSLSVANALTSINTTAANKMFDLNVATAQEISIKVSEISSEALQVKDTDSLQSFQSKFAQPNYDNVANYVKASFDIANSASTEVTKLMEDAFSDANAAVVASIDNAEKNGVPGSALAASSIKALMSFVNQAYDTASKSSKQAQEVVTSSVENATKAAKKKK